MQRLHIVGAWDRQFHDKSFIQHLRIVGVWACNFKKSNQASQVYSYISVGCCIRLEQQCFILRRQVFFHVSVGCCICQLEIKSHFKQTIQNFTSQQNQKQNVIHLSVDCWIQASASEETAAIFGWRLVYKCHFKSWTQPTRVKLRFHIGSACQVSQLTQVNLCFSVSSACQVSLTRARLRFLTDSACQVTIWSSTSSLLLS
jgi:hypothetical protein